MLVRLRQMGADAVSTIVPWLWHEPHDDVFDLSGISHPERDLTGFLETCQAMGLPVTLSVSPYLSAGLLGGGVPGWLLAEHPEIRALGPDSQPRREVATGSLLPSAEHPTYLKYVERWYQALSSALESWAWPEGPIVALQAGGAILGDSEPQSEGIPAEPDYNPHVVEVQWPIWLRQGYDGIDALNAAWQTDYHSFSDAEFPRPLEVAELSSQVNDATRFLAYAAAHAVKSYTRLLREAGWAGPVLTEADADPAAPQHVAQVDPEPPHIGAGVRWAMNAPVRADGSPRRGFWALKAAMWEMEDEVMPVEGGTLVTASESRRFRLPRPAGDYGVYRLLMDGRLVEAPTRKRGDMLLLDYLAADELGETDMYVIQDDASAPLTGYLNECLKWLLTGRALALQGAGLMCQALADALSGATQPPSEVGMPPSPPASDDLQTAQQSLVDAQRAARRAAASVGRLERLAGEVRGDAAPATASTLPDLSAFAPHEQELLAHVHESCTQAAPILMEAAQTLTIPNQRDEPDAEGLTFRVYQVAFEEAGSASREAEAMLAGTLGRLRADLVTGALPLVAWTIQYWLTRTLQSLSAGVFDRGC
jgi:hypothetical protein